MRRVLLVEDEALWRAATSARLAAAGYDVLEKMGGDHEDAGLAAELIERLRDALG